MTRPTDVSYKGLEDWAESLTNDINADKLDGKHYLTIKSDWEGYSPAGSGGTPGGDLTGTYPNPTLLGIQNNPISGVASQGSVVLKTSSGFSYAVPSAGVNVVEVLRPISSAVYFTVPGGVYTVFITATAGGGAGGSVGTNLLGPTYIPRTNGQPGGSTILQINTGSGYNNWIVCDPGGGGETVDASISSSGGAGGNVRVYSPTTQALEETILARPESNGTDSGPGDRIGKIGGSTVLSAGGQPSNAVAGAALGYGSGGAGCSVYSDYYIYTTTQLFGGPGGGAGGSIYKKVFTVQPGWIIAITTVGAGGKPVGGINMNANPAYGYASGAGGNGMARIEW